MSFNEKFAEFKGLSRSALSERGKEALMRIIKSGMRHGIEPEYLSAATFGLYVLFTTADGSVDQAELDLYNSFGGDPIDGEEYVELAKKAASEDGAKAILMCVRDVLDADHSLIEPFADLAMIAFVVNGEVTQDEKEIYVSIFG